MELPLWCAGFKCRVIGVHRGIEGSGRKLRVWGVGIGGFGFASVAARIL